jgi:hypothetical protein
LGGRPSSRKSRLAADRRPGSSRNRHTPALVRWRLHDEAGEAAAVAPKALESAPANLRRSWRRPIASGWTKSEIRRTIEIARLPEATFKAMIQEVIEAQERAREAATSAVLRRHAAVVDDATS